MYTPGNILYFTPFYFPNGEKEKNKYFIVLAANQENTLIATLPTSKDHIPSNVEKTYEIVGKLKTTELTAIKNCVKNSRTVKRKIRRALGAKI